MYFYLILLPSIAVVLPYNDWRYISSLMSLSIDFPCVSTLLTMALYLLVGLGAVSRSGRLYTWGAGINGRLGTGNGDDQLLPVRIRDLDKENCVSKLHHDLAICKGHIYRCFAVVCRFPCWICAFLRFDIHRSVNCVIPTDR